MRTSSSLLLALAFGGSLAGYTCWACAENPRSVESLERVEMEVEPWSVPHAKYPSELPTHERASPRASSGSVDPSSGGGDATEGDEPPTRARMAGDTKATTSSGPTFEFVRASLAAAIESDLPALALSESELDVIADATLRLRSAQQSLRTTPAHAQYAGERAALRRQVEEAISDFHDVLGIDPAEFSRRVGAGMDIDSRTSANPRIPVLIRPIVPGDARR